MAHRQNRPICNMNCSVFGCSSRKSKEPDIHFHRFPEPRSGYVNVLNKLGILEKMDRRKAWELKLCYGKPVTKYMRVCSKHFKLDDYVTQGLYQCAPKLKRTAVPSQNLPNALICQQNVYNTHSERTRYQQGHILSEKYFASKPLEEVASCSYTPDDIKIEEQETLYEDWSDDEKVVLHSLLAIQGESAK